MALYKHLLVILLACLISSCYAYQFYVGGRAGWVPNPPENYIHWAERMRFQVNDTLVFKYKKGSNSVLVVNKDDYDKCNTNNPIKKMDDGNSIFKFDHSGPFYFISGNKNDCQNGAQKLITVVLAIRPPPPPPTTPPSTPGTPPATSPATPPVVSPTPAVSPATSPVSQPPTSPPANAPSPATSPAASPAVSPATSPSPTTSPATSPVTSPPPAPTTSPATPSSPTTSPTTPTTPGSPGNSPSGGGAPAAPGGNSPPADIQSPTGSKNSAVKAFTTTSTVLVSIVLTIIISA